MIKARAQLAAKAAEASQLHVELKYFSGSLAAASFMLEDAIVHELESRCASMLTDPAILDGLEAQTGVSREQVIETLCHPYEDDLDRDQVEGFGDLLLDQDKGGERRAWRSVNKAFT